MVLNVNEVATILYVKPESVRRWIRVGVLMTNKRMGRNGSSIELESLVQFVNRPPGLYIHHLEKWLTENGIKFNKIEKPIYDVNEDNYIVLNDTDNEQTTGTELDLEGLILSEGMRLCVLKQELARITAQISISESQIEYWRLLQQKTV